MEGTIKTLSPLSLLLLLLCLCKTAQSLTYTPVKDADLFDSSNVVVLGNVLSISFPPASSNSFSRTLYQVEIEELIKGDVSSKEITLAVHGIPANTLFDAWATENHILANASSLVVPGAPSFSIGERCLFFLLNAESEDHYHIHHFALGAFHQAQSRTRSEGVSSFAIRSVDINSVSAEAEIRDFDKFVTWLRARSQGKFSPIEHLLPADLYEPESHISSRYTLAKDGNGAFIRWFTFDNGGAVNWKAWPASGQPGLNGGGFAQIQTAMGAWNSEPYTNINYQYTGVAGVQGNGWNSRDGVTEIMFNDPLGNVPGSYDCNVGGVMAVGGYWANSYGSYKGANYASIAEGDVIINTNVQCVFPGGNDPNRIMDALLTHELGHSLGLDHSCILGQNCVPGSPQDQAIMRSYVQMDGRGAKLMPDDIEAIYQLYRTCYPSRTCSTSCGTFTDNCGGVQNCGNNCGSGKTCGANNVCVAACVPTSTCSNHCGTFTDECGTVRNCGSNCGAGLVCANNTCVKPCVPTITCAKRCGTITDDCGVVQECGQNCPVGTMCGTGNECVCKPTTCELEGKTCGVISDKCGESLTCGTCVNGTVCSAFNLCEPVEYVPPIDKNEHGNGNSKPKSWIYYGVAGGAGAAMVVGGAAGALFYRRRARRRRAAGSDTKTEARFETMEMASNITQVASPPASPAPARGVAVLPIEVIQRQKMRQIPSEWTGNEMVPQRKGSVPSAPVIEEHIFGVGQLVSAVWSGDGKEYSAKILDLKDDQCLLNFVGYPGQEWVHISKIKP